METFAQYFTEAYSDESKYATPELVAAFNKVHDHQRWKGPESMFEERSNPGVSHGTGSWTYFLEHGGDLIHRSSYTGVRGDFGGGGIHYGRGATLEKAQRIYDACKTKPGWMTIETDIKEQIERNYAYNVREEDYTGTLEQWWKEVKEAGERYSQAYEKIEPVTEIQKLGRDTAIALGRFNFKAAEQYTGRLIKLLKSKNWEELWWKPLK